MSRLWSPELLSSPQSGLLYCLFVQGSQILLATEGKEEGREGVGAELSNLSGTAWSIRIPAHATSRGYFEAQKGPSKMGSNTVTQRLLCLLGERHCSGRPAAPTFPRVVSCQRGRSILHVQNSHQKGRREIWSVNLEPHPTGLGGPGVTTNKYNVGCHFKSRLNYA